MTSSNSEHYFIPESSHWPLIASVSVFVFTLGIAFWINDLGYIVFVVGVIMLAYLFYGWFNQVITESMAGSYNAQVDHTFRQGMMWFIASEVFFFVSFFGALFYLRNISVPYLSGEGHLGSSHLLWDSFVGAWPLLELPDASKFTPAKAAVGASGIPLWNTIILLTSGATLTWAHHGLQKNRRAQLISGMFLTVALGILFFALQMYEYGHAYNELGLKLTSGAYGSIFYMLTGFHGFHVTLGTIMLMVILVRCIRGHFSTEQHFAFEAVAWYWHFVDVVWIGLFIFVYWF
jgi:cytochrome c oxidase subunit 3